MRFLKEFFKQNAYLLLITALAFAGALSRLVPHPMNFAPITALALLGGFYFKKSWQSFLIPMSALLLSDLFLEPYTYVWAVYGSFFLIAFASRLAPKNLAWVKKMGFVIPSTLFFFFVTNSAYFFQGGLYPFTIEGYFACLAAGIPFLKNAITGDLFYGVVLLGTAELLRSRMSEKLFKSKNSLSFQ